MKHFPSGAGASLAVSVIVFLSTAGCVTPTTPGQMTDRLPRPGARIVLGTVSNATLHQFEFDAESELAEAMTEELTRRNLLASDPPEPNDFVLNITITEYRPGDAFKAWMLPGWGSMVVSLRLNLFELDGKTPVAELFLSRSAAGGVFDETGSALSVIKYMASDLGHDLAVRIAKGGNFVIEAGSRGDSVVTDGPRAELPPVWLEEIRDRRPITGYIGKREAAFGVSMGEVYFSRSVPGFVRENIELELTAAGHRLSPEDGAIRLDCDLNRFWLHTDTTALYWDIIIEISLDLSQPGQTSGWKKNFSATARQRTYVYPSNVLCAKVISSCMDDLMKQLRQDDSWH